MHARGTLERASSALQKILAQDASYRDAPELLVQVDAALSGSAGDPTPPWKSQNRQPRNNRRWNLLNRYPTHSQLGNRGLPAHPQDAGTRTALHRNDNFPTPVGAGSADPDSAGSVFVIGGLELWGGSALRTFTVATREL